MAKKKQTRKPRLNKKQRAWVEKFKAQHPGAKLREIHEGLSSDRIVTLEWAESLPQIVLPDCADRGSGWIFHTITVKLRVFGDPRHSAHHQHRIIYHHCSIDSDLKLLPRGQLLITAAGVKPLGFSQWQRENFYLYGVVEPLSGYSFFYEFSHQEA